MYAKRSQLSLRLNKELDDKIAELSHNMGVSKNAFILMVLSKEVQKAG